VARISAAAKPAEKPHSRRPTASTPSSPARADTTETSGAVVSETAPAGSETRATAQKNSGGLLR